MQPVPEVKQSKEIFICTEHVDFSSPLFPKHWGKITTDVGFRWHEILQMLIADDFRGVGGITSVLCKEQVTLCSADLVTQRGPGIKLVQILLENTLIHNIHIYIY